MESDRYSDEIMDLMKKDNQENIDYFDTDLDLEDISKKTILRKNIYITPWVEELRPKMMSEIVANKDIINILNTYIENQSFPHLILYGPPGTGKTSIMNVCAYKLYNNNSINLVLRINASEERGIETIRNKVKEFVLTKIFDNEYKFKLVILDEADSMTFSAQGMLRRIIEDFTENARFCLICNKIKNIDPAIQSRCVSFRFSQLDDKLIKEKVINICSLKKIKYTDDGLDFLIHISNGDMRRVINNIQTVFLTYKIISIDNVSKCLSYPTEQDIEFIINTTKKNNLLNSVNIIRDFIEEKQLSILDLCREIHNVILNKFLINIIDRTKFISIIKKLSQVEKNIYLCPSTESSFLSLICCFY